MARMIKSGVDVVSFLKEQHDQIEMAFEQVLATSGDDRESAFFALRRLLAVHETAEEEIVHPAAKSAVPNGAAVVEARLDEERAAKKLLSDLERLDVDSPEFETQLERLRTNVVAHAVAEELEEFEPLGGALDQSRLERMRDAVDFAERIAPTRPHAGLESPMANLLVGPFAAMLDRARDAIARKS
jgi:hypothetical protein